MMRKRPKIKLLLSLCAFSSLGFITIAHARDMTEYPIAKLQYLDKVTARTKTFEAPIGTTMNFGRLFVSVKSCQKSSPIDQPESAAFLQVWEGGKDKDSEWVYSGWMFASSPGLSSMDHPVYDVWVLDCVEDEAMKKAREDAEAAAKAESETPAETSPEDITEDAPVEGE